MAPGRPVYLRLSPENFVKVDGLLGCDRDLARPEVECLLARLLTLTECLALQQAVLERRRLVVIIE